MSVSTIKYGALEAVYSALDPNPPTPPGYNVCTVFTVMSNEVNTPKILFCPADNGIWITTPRSASTNWVTFDPTINAGTLTFQYLSYFVCGDAFENYPQMILTGDRNIGTVSGTARWGSGPASTPAWAWDNASLHLKNGNLGLADGSVQQTTIAALQQALTAATNNEPNLSPYYNFPQ